MLISNQEQILAKVLLRAQSLAVPAVETDFKSEKGYLMDNSCHTDYTSFKATPPSFFGGSHPTLKLSGIPTFTEFGSQPSAVIARVPNKNAV